MPVAFYDFVVCYAFVCSVLRVRVRWLVCVVPFYAVVPVWLPIAVGLPFARSLVRCHVLHHPF